LCLSALYAKKQLLRPVLLKLLSKITLLMCIAVSVRKRPALPVPVVPVNKKTFKGYLGIL
jgi:hypothetical protein